jgi:serine protease AprX
MCFATMSAGPAVALNVVVPFVDADYAWSLGYTGNGVEVAVIDLFLADSSHPAIAGNYLGSEKFSKGAAFVGSHATQVTGTFASQDATYKGVAPNVGWWTGQTTNPGSISSQRTQTIAAETFAQGLAGLGGDPAEVITLSIGLGGSTNGTDQWSLGLDHIVDTEGATIAVAAGNSGPGPGTLDGLPTGAYNTILVGATGDAARNYNTLADFSSRGPTADGRTKPDIIAPGTLLHLPTVGGGWSDVSGTSFATPMVAGGAALLIGAGNDLGYSTDPRVVKSVLLNSADKLTGWTHGPTSPLDVNQGAGQMNLRGAFDQYLSGRHGPGTVPGTGWDLGQAASAAEKVYVVDGVVSAGATMTATLNWNRVVATDVEDIEDAVYSVSQFDNLNLYLYDADNLTSPLAFSVGTIDNVEHIVFTAPAAGRYALGVRLFGTSADGVETYGLSWDVATSPLVPGDANFDGAVDLQDFGVLKDHYSGAGGWAEGDFNGDGTVDLQDFGILKDHFAQAAAPVPEPAAGILLASASLVLRRRRRAFED